MLVFCKGQRIRLSPEMEYMWGLLMHDITDMLPCGSQYCESVDGCVGFMKDEFFMRLGLSIDSATMLCDFAHICPHVLEPCTATGLVEILCRRMQDSVGFIGAARTRAAIVRELLKIPGAPPEVEPIALMEDCLKASLLVFVEVKHNTPKFGLRNILNVSNVAIA